MPITSSIHLPRLTLDEMRSLDYEVMRHSFACHNDLGRLCDESVYQADLAARLSDAGLGPVVVEAPVHVSFRDFSKKHLLDAVVAGKAIYELKTAVALTSAHEAQMALLLQHSPLRAMYWVNIGLNLISFVSISRKIGAVKFP